MNYPRIQIEPEMCKRLILRLAPDLDVFYSFRYEDRLSVDMIRAILATKPEMFTKQLQRLDEIMEDISKISCIN